MTFFIIQESIGSLIHRKKKTNTVTVSRRDRIKNKCTFRLDLMVFTSKYNILPCHPIITAPTLTGTKSSSINILVSKQNEP